MGTLSSLVRDPSKSLMDIEEKLGGGPGSLLREMRDPGGDGDEWKAHLPSTLAATYFEDPEVRKQFQAHVDGCEYCQGLLDAMHPSNVESALFANHAARVPHKHATKVWPVALAAALAAVVVTGLASLIAVPKLQMAGLVDTPEIGDTLASSGSGQRAAERLIASLREHPGKLAMLEVSKQPFDRYVAANYYFAVDKPELAYQQIGQGLRLAGVHAADAKKIIEASNLPSDSSSAQDLAKAAQELPQLAASAKANDPADYLEIAEAQAKLGRHPEALVAIQQYLKATNADRRVLEDFSKVELAKPATP